MKAKPLGKRRIDRITNNIDDQFHQLYQQAYSHVPMDISEAALCEAMVKGEDLPLIRRSAELFGYTRANNFYGGATHTVVNDFPGTDYKVRITLGRRATWLMPNYLAGKELSAAQLSPEFVTLLQPFVSTLNPLRQAMTTAMQGWAGLRRLCDDDLGRMYFLWPVLGTLAKRLEIDISSLPKPRGVPAVSPELREQLNEGTAFVNMISMMPPQEPISTERLSITLG